MKSLLLFVYLLIAACTSYEGPDSIGPNGSQWIGGPDGGIYLHIKDDEIKNDNIYYAEIYYDYSKEIWYKGLLKLNTNKPFNIENFDQFSDWDGEKLHLKNNGYLTAYIPID